MLMNNRKRQFDEYIAIVFFVLNNVFGVTNQPIRVWRLMYFLAVLCNIHVFCNCYERFCELN